MKHRYSFFASVKTLLSCVSIFIMTNGLFAQNAGIQTSDPSDHYFDNATVVTARPVQFLPSLQTSVAEQHFLGALTPAEMQLIRNGVEPPVIGVYRSLPEPLVFRLSASDLSDPSSRTISGGRLAMVNPDTAVWTSSFGSRDAAELRIFFSEGHFPNGVKVNIFSRDDYAFNQPELTGDLSADGFYTTTTYADKLILQVVVPVAAMTEDLHFTIGGMIHADRRFMNRAPNVDCFEDVNCTYANSYANIAALKYSASQLTFLVGGSYYICSGNLLNDNRGADWQPFLLTANHCFSTQASAASLEALFDYYSVSCNGATNPSYITVNGANLLATNTQSDFTLVLLKANPGGYRYYLGWTNGGVPNDETVHSVNHPAGMIQKYYRALNKTSPDFSCGGLPTANFHYTRAIGGETVGGSSGGNLVNNGGWVIGQLYGWCYLNGATECNYPSYYNVWGKFEISYNNNNLGYWLNNGGASVAMGVSPASTLGFSTLNVGNYQQLNVTVTNTGTVPNYMNLEAGNAYISGTNADQFAIIGTSYLYLAPGASGTITVRFTPTSSGAKTAILNIPHNANNAGTPYQVTLTGAAEPCSNIISMGYGGEANAKTYSKSGSGIWYTSWNTPCGYQCPGNEQIYSFTAPYTGNYSIAVTSTNGYYLDYMWKTNCDGGVWNCIQDIWTPGTYGSLNFAAGITYYILVDAEATALVTQSFYIFLNPCQNITSIAGTGVANSQTYTGGPYGGWNTYSPAVCGYYAPGIEKVYSFVAPYTGYYSIQVTANNDYYVDYFWSTSCGSSGWTCIQDISSPGQYGNMFWTAGTTYYILLDDENTIAGTQTFYINPPDPCRGIIPLACNQALDYPGGGPGVQNGFSCFYSTPGFEQIYSFTAPSTGQYSIRVNSAGSWVDYMWSTSCSGPWTCIQDIYSPGQYGSMSWTAGTTYYIMLDDEDNLAGIHNFSVVCPELCHACGTYDFQIYPTTNWQTGSSSIESLGCKMFRFYANAGAKYTFKTGCGDGGYANYDTYLELYNDACTWLAADDDGCGYPYSKLEWTAPAAGYYYLKVRGFSTNFGNFTLAYNYCVAAPGAPGGISGPNPAIQGNSNYYSIAPVAGATSYSWTYSGTGTVSGAGTLATLIPGSSGVLSVTANNICGVSSPVTLNITTIPLNLTLQNVAITPGSFPCYAAAQTITLAGGGSFFFVPNGANVQLVAGWNIFCEPGLLVQSGGYFHGRIATANDYCPPVPFKTGDEESGTETANQIAPAAAGDMFRVYPNPTTGDFTLELSSEPEGENVSVECYTLLGAKIISRELSAGRKHSFSLGSQAPGLYILKVSRNGTTGMQKIVRQ